MKEITKEDIDWIYHLPEIGLAIVKEADKLKFMLEEIEEMKRRHNFSSDIEELMK